MRLACSTVCVVLVILAVVGKPGAGTEEIRIVQPGQRWSFTLQGGGRRVGQAGVLSSSRMLWAAMKPAE
ncbi:hypothetical protein ACWCO0_11515 [Streptomyces tubercidicus]